jgi:hypothetical protein
VGREGGENVGVSQLELRFGPPHHGWLHVELADSERSVLLDVSDVPGDSLAMLAVAALDLVAGRRETRVVWFLEPSEATWDFQREGDQVAVRATTSGAAFVLLEGGTVEELALVIWRALRRLEADPAWSSVSDGRVWSHPFPHREVAHLGAALGRASAPQRS